jgi:hypothetical protein
LCAGFWTPATEASPHARRTGVRKAPGDEVTVSRASGWEASAMGISGWGRVRWRRDPGRRDPDDCAPRRARGGKTRPGLGLKDVEARRARGLPGNRMMGLAAGGEPARQNGDAAGRGGSPAHDVSTLPGVGRHLGSRPRAKTSMTIMRAPQRGHEQGAARCASGVSGRCFGSAAGGSAPSSARAVVMFSARLALAKSP